MRWVAISPREVKKLWGKPVKGDMTRVYHPYLKNYPLVSLSICPTSMTLGMECSMAIAITMLNKGSSWTPCGIPTDLLLDVEWMEERLKELKERGIES